MTDRAARSTGIAWNEYRRWFLLGRVFRLSIQARLITLGTVGVMATIAGWWGAAQLFSGTDDPALQQLLKAYGSCPWKASEAGLVGEVLPFGFLRSDMPEMGEPVDNPYLDPFHRLSAPWRQLFDVARTVVGTGFLLLCAVWAALAWGLIGGAIARAVVVQLAREEAISLGSATKHAAQRWKSYFAAPLFPLIAVAIAVLPAVGIGLLMHVSLLVAGILWPIALLCGLIAAIMLVGLSVGWPLMHAAISTEGSDSFDALSRSYSYVYQRPLHYLFYAVSATVLGALGMLVVNLFAAAVQTLAAWGASWGGGAKLIETALSGNAGSAWGPKLFWFWDGVIDAIVLGFAFAFFWSASTAIYLLLRHDVDGTELDETHLEDDGGPHGLPTLATDAAGVKVVPESESVPSAPPSPS